MLRRITYHDTTIDGWAKQCYSINDNNTAVTDESYATCGVVVDNTPPAPGPTPAPATYYGPTSKIWNDTSCKVLKNINANLSNCKIACDNTTGCTAFNYSDKEQACILRECAVGTEPTWDYPPYQGYSNYKTSEQKSNPDVTPAPPGVQYYDPSMASPSISPNVTPNGFAPSGHYSNNWPGSGNSTCTYCSLDFDYRVSK